MIGVIIFCASCIYKETDRDINPYIEEQDNADFNTDKPHNFVGYEANDVAMLSEVLTVEYSIDDLNRYFAGHNENESVGYSERNPKLTIKDVEQVFPVEIVRSNGYSVYRVQEGGFFYVFWAGWREEDASDTESEPTVYFTTYISGNMQREAFKSIENQKSTLRNVKEIDPYTELCLLMSHGVYAYSYLSRDEVIEIAFGHQEKDDYDEMIVENVEVIPRSSSLLLSLILDKDLPY